MSVDYTQPQPVPPPEPRRGGCGRRGCVIGCVLALLLFVLLLGAVGAGVYTLVGYVSSLRSDTAPCQLLDVGIRFLEYGIEHPSQNTTPRDIEEMRQALAQIQAEYNRRCSPSQRLVWIEPIRPV